MISYLRKAKLVPLIIAALITITPNALADEFKAQRCVNMGNALDAPNEGDWGHVIDTANFAKIKAAGFDSVRIPVRWSNHLLADGITIQPKFAARVQEVVDIALAQDLYVVLNVHHFEELNEDPEAHAWKLPKLWAQISALYADYPDNLYFEIINEPNGAYNGDIMRSSMGDSFDEIRKTHPTRIIIMGGENWNSLDAIGSIPYIEDPNQVYTFHYYNPFKFTHQKAGWTDLKNSGTVRFGSREDIVQINRDAERAKELQDTLGVKLFLGEFGAYEKAPYNDSVQYYNVVSDAFEQRGMAWCAWSFTATFPLFDQDTGKWDKQKLRALGLNPTP